MEAPSAHIAELSDELLPGSCAKLEDSPSAPKIARLRSTAPSLHAVGALGGVGLLHELDAGADGTMTGFAVPELLVEIVSANQAGERGRARRIFESELPLLAFEAQPVLELGLRKEILRRRGAIQTAIRSPAPVIDPPTLEALDELPEAVEVPEHA